MGRSKERKRKVKREKKENEHERIEGGKGRVGRSIRKTISMRRRSKGRERRVGNRKRTSRR